MPHIVPHTALRARIGIAPGAVRGASIGGESPPSVVGADLTSMQSSGRELGERGRGGALEIGLRRVGGGQGIGVLALGGYERAACVQHVERRYPPESITDVRDPERFAGRREDLIAQINELLQRRGGGRVRRADILVHGRSQVAVRGFELALVVPVLRDFASGVL